MAKVSMPLQFSRMYEAPLDPSDTFETYQDAVTYAQSAIGYPGHVIAVKAAGIRRDVYVINENKTLSQLYAQRVDADIILEAQNWETIENGYKHTVQINYLEDDDNTLIVLSNKSTPAQMDAIINAKITNIVQQSKYIEIYAEGKKPEINVPVRIIIGGLVSSVQYPYNAGPRTNMVKKLVSKSDWTDNCQRIDIEDLKKEDKGIITVSSGLSDDSMAQVMNANLSIDKQENGYIMLKAQSAQLVPKVDFYIDITYGDDIAIVKDHEFLTSKNLMNTFKLHPANWQMNSDISETKLSQTFVLDGMTPDLNGSIYIPETVTSAQLNAINKANISIVQDNDLITFVCNGTVPTITINLGIVCGDNIYIIEQPVYVGVQCYTVNKLLNKNSWILDNDKFYKYVFEEPIIGLTDSTPSCISLRNNISVDVELDATNSELSVESIDNNIITLCARYEPTMDIPVTITFGEGLVIMGNNNFIKNTEAQEAKHIIFDNTKAQLTGKRNMQEVMDYTLERLHTSEDPSKSIILDSWNGLLVSMIMKDSMTSNYYTLCIVDGKLETRVVDSKIIRYLKNVDNASYPIDLYNNRDKFKSGDEMRMWSSQTTIDNVVFDIDTRRIIYNTTTNYSRKLAVGNILEILNDIKDNDKNLEYVVYDVTVNAYYRVKGNKLYFSGSGQYKLLNSSNYLCCGTTKERPKLSNVEFMIYYDTDVNSYYKWSGSEWFYFK